MKNPDTPTRPLLIRSLPGLMLLFTIWSVYGIEQLFDLQLHVLGVIPRRLEGLPGIIFSPLVHGSIAHLISNSLPLLILTTGIFYFYKKVAFEVFVWLWISTGFWVWCMARPSHHIGASGLVYAFAFFLFFMGLMRWERWSVAIALLVAFLYGGLLYGLMPGKPGISWESHMLGGLAGFLLAVIYRKKDVGTASDPSLWSKKPDLESPLPFEGPYWMADEDGNIPEELMPKEPEEEYKTEQQPASTDERKIVYHYVAKKREEGK